MVGIFGLACQKKDSLCKENVEDLVKILRRGDCCTERLMLGSGFLGTVELLSSRGKNGVVFDNDLSLAGISRGSVGNKKEIIDALGALPSIPAESETQFLINLYQKKGLEFARYINGLFNVAINDEKNRRIIIVNDRYGFYPLFYALSNERFVFASEAKFILRATNIAPKMNKMAISEFFTLSYLLGEKTFFEGIRLMKPASIMIFNKAENKVETKQYWDFSIPKRSFDTQGILFEDFKRLMGKAVERAIQGNKKIGVFLSGGLDSRAIAAFATRTDAEVVAFTFGNKDSFEQKIAARVAEKLKIKYVLREIPSDFIANYAEKIVYNGDGMIRIRDCHFIALLDEVKSMVDAVLLGTFGGELFGSKVTKKQRDFESKEEVIDYLFKKNTTVIPLDEYQEAFGSDFKNAGSELLERFHRTFDQIQFGLPEDIVEYWEYRNRQIRYIFQSFQYMNWYLDMRHPFLDTDLVEFFALGLPYNSRLNESFLQKALNYCFPSLSDIPWERTGAPPDAGPFTMWVGRGKLFLKNQIRRILERASKGKIGIAPRDYRLYGQWLRTGSKDYVARLLSDHRTLSRGFFNPGYIQRVLQEHMNFQENHDELVCDLVNFELLNRTFLEGFEPLECNVFETDENPRKV